MLLFPPFLLALLFNRYAYLILRMELRGKLYSLLNIISQIVSFALLLTLLLFFEKTFRSIILATIFSTIINTIIVFIITKESWKINKKYFEKELTKKMLFFAFPLVPATLISWLLNSFDKVALKVWSTYEELGLYAAAFKIVALLTIFQNIFTTSWIPIAYKWYEEKKPNELYEKISSLTSFIMTFIFACVVFFRNVIVILLGESYRNTTEIFIFLLFVPVMYTISEASTVGINLKKKTSYVLYATLIATLSNLFLNYLLVPKYGAIGAAIGTCISYVMFFFARVFFARRVWYKFPVANLLMNTSYMIALAVFVFFEAPKIIELALLVIIVITNFCYNRKNNIKFT
jgi:O-antigen/teichoic acid export membrane protein